MPNLQARRTLAPSYLTLLAALLCGIAANVACGDTQVVDGRVFQVADGYRLERVASTELSKRPIVADFDLQGRLYVAESSGSNAPVQQQLETRPHQILQLTDSDGDGKFDRRTVFADQMMFPEGATWHDGALYVAAPPQIWKLTDTDGDGVADKREVWFDGKTLTGCANDLHGPYVGLDGWMYWCKGAFAEQTYQRPTGLGGTLVTRASHIFRRRPEGGSIESVMTGGMDNPVELAFTQTGERIFTTTFFQHPGGGKRDGLIHAIYGGVYGKEHGVLEGHPRTGDLMPVLTHLGAAAPSGLTRLESNRLGWKHQLLTACFNLHTVTRHKLVPEGSSWRTIDQDLVRSDNLDFHPTDVLEAPDGSVIIVDTGGWYKLCCPTSQLPKPDVFGAIYRLSRKPNAAAEKGNRVSGPELADAAEGTSSLSELPAEQLVAQQANDRPGTRRRVQAELQRRGESSVAALTNTLTNSTTSDDLRIACIWTLCRIDHADARAAIRRVLADRGSDSAAVRQAAIHAVSVWRDSLALQALRRQLRAQEPTVRRVAAEALGRLGQAEVIPDLLSAAGLPSDRALEHALIYAMIEIGEAPPVRQGLASDNPRVVRAALLACHALPTQLRQRDLLAALADHRSMVRDEAIRLAAEYPQWSGEFADVLSQRWQHIHTGNPAEQAASPNSGTPNKAHVACLREMARLSAGAEVRALIREVLGDVEVAAALKRELLAELENRQLDDSAWLETWAELLGDQDRGLVRAVVQFLTPRTDAQRESQTLTAAFARLAGDTQFQPATRLAALPQGQALDGSAFALAVEHLSADVEVSIRSLATTILAEAKLTGDQRTSLLGQLSAVGPLELSRLLRVYEGQQDPQLGRQLVGALKHCAATASLPQARLSQLLGQFGEETAQAGAVLLAAGDQSPAEQAAHLQNLLETLPSGDVRRGQLVFHSSRAACFSCHAVGYRGGTVGPDLTHIGRVRSRRDLLESVVYPSASFVRSYEPVTVLTQDGESLSGTIKDQGQHELVLQLNATEQRRVAMSDVEDMVPSTVSVMPAGLEQQLTRQQLADLLEYLQSRR